MMIVIVITVPVVKMHVLLDEFIKLSSCLPTTMKRLDDNGSLFSTFQMTNIRQSDLVSFETTERAEPNRRIFSTGTGSGATEVTLKGGEARLMKNVAAGQNRLRHFFHVLIEELQAY